MEIDIVVTTVGSPFIMGIFSDPIQDSTICRDSIKNIINALIELKSSARLIIVSTTGVIKNDKNVSLLMKPFYDIYLRTAHNDKLHMEKQIIESNLQNWIIIRPAFLTNGKVTKEYQAKEEVVSFSPYTIFRADGRFYNE